MNNLLRELVVTIASKVWPSNVFLERLLAISILTRDYSEVLSVKKYNSREEMWSDGLRQLASGKLTYLEFGVWNGESIKYIANLVSNENAQFFGFDSFEGLPEKWDTMSGTMKKGMWSADGILPETNDKRIKFVRGWFQNTVQKFISSIEHDSDSSLVVHYDADLYSSTLLCLMKVDTLKKKYLAIFDEFPGHETRALYNYQQATGAKVEFIGRVGPSKKYPKQVMAWITPQKKYTLLKRPD